MTRTLVQTMDEGRLKAVKKGQKLHRKFAYAMNDTIRNRQQYYQNCLSREEQEAQARLMTKVINIRKTVVRNRVLLQCLNLHRKNQPDRAHTEPLLGSYGGRPIDSFTRDIDQRLAWFHPRLRRLRKVDRVKQSCIKQGEILDEETIKDRMEDFFTRNQDLYPEGEAGKPIKPNNDNGNNQHHHSNHKNDVNDDDDDDDFDIRDYHNPIAGANFKLRLHPFGNLVDFDNKGETKKFNLLTRRNVFVRNSEPSWTRAGDSAPANQSLLVSISSEREFHERTRSKSPSQKAKGAHSVSHSSPKPPQDISKYPNPLPPIASSTVPTGHKSKDFITNKSEQLGNIKHNVKVGGNQSKGGERGHGQESQAANHSNVHPTSENGKPSKLTRRKTLVLPPLETSKEMIKNKE